MKWISFKCNVSGSPGYLTVFLALSLTVILSLCVALVEGARSNGARFMTEYAMDVGMNSILAEYHRELLRQYDVFAIDMSYGSNQPSVYKTTEHLKEYMEHNFSCKDIKTITDGTDMYGLSVQNIRLGNLSVLTDGHGSVFYTQAVDYMKDKYGVTLLSKAAEWEKVIEEYQLDSGSVQAQRDSVEGQIQEQDGSEIQVSEEEWVTVDVENPADQVNAQRNVGILLLAMENTDELSNIGFNKTLAASERELYVGKGVRQGKKIPDNLAERMLFDEYILEKCSRYGAEMEKSYMKYQVEYILAGKDNDLENMKSIATRLLMIREAANVAYLMGDSVKRAEISALAATVSAITLLPQLQVLLEYSILFAWAFAESVTDVRTLFSGGKVPLIKNSENWKTGLASILEQNFQDATPASEDVGLSYEDYLRVLLKIMNNNQKIMRVIDMAELDIRKTKGNANFRMDGCVDAMKIEVNVISSYGNAFLMQRDCYYE